MKYSVNDIVGRRGENIFSAIIGRCAEPDGHLLSAYFLGEKFSAVDFYVELLKYDTKRGFFFASVKATRSGYDRTFKKIRIKLNKKEIAELNKFQAPVYLFAIDERQETGYFICANKLDKSKTLNGIPLTYPINRLNIHLLWKEVANYWESNNEISKFVSVFN